MSNIYRLPIRAIAPEVESSFSEFKNNYLLIITLLAAFIGIGTLLSNNIQIILSFAGIAVFIFSVYAWSLWIVEIDEYQLVARSGVVHKYHESIFLGEISHASVDQDRWGLVLGLVNLKLFSRGDSDAAITLEHITKKQAEDICEKTGQSLVCSKTDTEDFYFKQSKSGSLMGSLMVSVNRTGAHGVGLLTTLYATISFLFKKATGGSGEVYSTLDIFNMVLNANFIDLHLVDTLSTNAFFDLFIFSVLIIFIGSLCYRFLIMFPVHMTGTLSISDGEVKYRFGILKNRQWSLPINAITELSISNGSISKLCKGRSLTFHTVTTGSHSSPTHFFVPFMPEDVLSDIFELLNYPLPSENVNKLRPFSLRVLSFQALLLSKKFAVLLAAFALINTQQTNFLPMECSFLLSVIFLKLLRQQRNSFLIPHGNFFFSGSNTIESSVRIFPRESIKAIWCTQTPFQRVDESFLRIHIDGHTLCVYDFKPDLINSIFPNIIGEVVSPPRITTSFQPLVIQ